MVIKELGDLYSKFGKRVPWHVDWEITYRCQNKCKHCYLMHKDKDIKLELDTRIVHRTLDELKQLGTVEIGFTGGDPFLYQGFFDVLSHASKNNFNIIIFTSGVGISQHDIKSLLQHNIVKMEFTFFGDNEKTHDAFTSNDGSFNRMLETVSLLHERGIHCIAKMIITSQNKNQVQNLKHRMENMGVSFSFDPHIWRPYHGTEDDIKNYRISSEDMLKYYQWQHINYVSN